MPTSADIYLYSDDPLNSTSADHPEWLDRFKRDVGILPKDSGPGLERRYTPPLIAEGDVPSAALFPPLQNKTKTKTTTAAATSHSPVPSLGSILSSRQLEKGLAEFVKRELHRTGGVFPSDDALRERARNILAMQSTPCDDPVKLGRFKAALHGAVAIAPPPTQLPTVETAAAGAQDGFDTVTAKPQLPLPGVSGITTSLQTLAPTTATSADLDQAAASASAEPSLGFGLDAINNPPAAAMDLNLALDMDLDIGDIGDISSF